MPSQSSLSEGDIARLGAVFDGRGVNFALFSAHAEKVELCIFSDSGEQRIALPARTGDIWHGYLEGARPGLLYGYRVHGPYAPARGHRFNPHKLLIDPCARALTASFSWDDRHCGYTVGHPEGDLSFDMRDNAALMPKCVVIRTQDDLGPLASRGSDAIYELHVRGFTKGHSDVPRPLRGTLAGLAAPAVLRHLERLGIGAVELLPITPSAMSRRLARAGLINYWGYNPINFFAAEPRYLAGGAGEFAAAVSAFHGAGIAVILDVVFNHSGEEDETGPTVSLRGIDNAAYYRLAEDPRRYLDWTGCKNTLNTAHPGVRRMILESLRHWASLGVDGFRLDLAVTLGRDEAGVFSAEAPLLAAIRADPVLSKLQLIGEPWDLGPQGHRPGAFGEPWAEWNDRYRDTLRRFWRGDGGVGDVATRLAGSSDIFPGRASASINYVTSHDGFTLADLVSYSRKRNDANLEDGRDGTDENFSWNAGVEGPSGDPAIAALRRRQMRNLLASLLLSAGTPMLRAGDEFAQSQGGNNNPYCQDNEASWIEWPEAEPPLAGFIARLLGLRRRIPVLLGAPPDWFSPGGQPMTLPEWEDPHAHVLGMRRGTSGASTIMLLNGGETEVPFLLPETAGGVWHLVLSTIGSDAGAHRAGEAFALPAHSLFLFSEREEARARDER
jgi:glycogen operon protein